MDTTEAIIVAYDYKQDSDNAVLIVGQKNKIKDIEIINAFQGDEATELWNKLTTKK